MWNPARPDSLAPPEGGGAADFAAPMAAPSGAGSGLSSSTRLVETVVIALALAWLLFWYRDTALAMESIWNRSGTFAHGYLVAPISLWLIWRKRAVLGALPMRPSLIGLLAGFASGFAWLLAELASVDSVAQFALVGMLISTIWALGGTALARALAFPLGFLFFCVPFGEFLFPTMMDATASFVVGALRLSGVPVFVEGRSLVIPSGHWQVVEECSGVRYLIASIVVGCLYAYLNYRNVTRRLAFITMAVAMPIVANWFRAYGTVMLGHISDNRLATGVDHLVYGWVFFGIVMLGLFWIGSRWREPEEALAKQFAGVPRPVAVRPATGLGRWVLAAIGITLGLSLAFPVLRWLESRDKQGAVTLPHPTPVAGWIAADMSRLPKWAPNYIGISAEDRSTWARNGDTVGLYLGYYRNQEPGRELINSQNQLIHSRDAHWALSSYGDRAVVLPEGATTAHGTEIVGPRGRLLVWRWYWIGGRVTSSDYVAKALLALARLTGRGDDSAVVMLYTSENDDGRVQADEVLADFVATMGPSVSRTLASAAEQ